MIGDIDFIIQHKDEGKIKRVLEKNKYRKKDSLKLFRLFKPKHLPRRINENKKIAIEPHLELLSPRWRSIFDSKQLKQDFKKGVKTYKTPNISFLVDHCIYAIQIEDKGFFTSYHSHRAIYDIYKLNCKNSLTIKNGTKDIYVRHFFTTIAKFNIFDLQIISSFWSLCQDKCLKVLIFIFIKISTSIQKYSNKILTLAQLPCNKNLRKRGLNKITYHYANKTLLKYIYRWVKT